MTATDAMGSAATTRTASTGLSAFKMAGAFQTLTIPRIAMVTNQMTMIGPKSRPMLAVIVGAQDENHIFQRHDQQQCPESQRHDPNDVARQRRPMAGRIEGDRERVERAGADVAVNDPYRGEREEPSISLVVLRLGLVN